MPKNKGLVDQGWDLGLIPESNKKLLKGSKQICHVTGFEF